MDDRELKAEVGRMVADLRQSIRDGQESLARIEVADQRLGALCQIREERYRSAVAALRELWSHLEPEDRALLPLGLSAEIRLILESTK